MAAAARNSWLTRANACEASLWAAWACRNVVPMAPRTLERSGGRVLGAATRWLGDALHRVARTARHRDRHTGCLLERLAGSAERLLGHGACELLGGVGGAVLHR